MHSSVKELDSIYVINVKKFSKRRQFIEFQLEKLGVKAEFIHDWDIEDLSPEVLENFFNTSTLSQGQMSCGLKHIVALQKIVANNLQKALILEDDAILSPDFNSGIKYALAERDDFTGSKVIFLGCGGNFYTPKSQRKPGQHLYLNNKGRFTDSYIIDAATAQQRLEWIDTHKISAPIDQQFEKIDREMAIKMIWLEEPVVEQGSKTGLFTTALEKVWPSWIQRLSFAWEKLRRKYIYQLWR